MTSGPTYVLKQKLMSLSGDAWIEDDRGERIFEVDGKAFHLRRTVKLNDRNGTELFHIAKSLAHIHNTFELQQSGVVVATIQEGLIGILGDKFSVKFKDGRPELKIKGDIIDHDFSVTRDGTTVIRASRKLISLRDSYGVQVTDGFDPGLAMAIVIAIEQMEKKEHDDEVARSADR